MTPAPPLPAASFRIAASTSDVLGESPAWDARGGHLYWVDLRHPALHRLDPVAGEVLTWPMPEVTGAVVAREAGGVVVALKQALFAFDPQTGLMEQVAEVEDGPPDNRLNDAKCDPQGRIFCGSMWDYGLQTSGSLYRIDGGAVARVRGSVTIPNAIAFSPDGRTMYFSDTRKGMIERADYCPIRGELGPWSVFAEADAAPGRPDGATVDAEGCLWNARYQGGCLARFRPDGRLDRIVELPVSQPTSCAFGGPDLRTLFVTTATQKLSCEQLAAQPLAGSLLALEVGVSGREEPRYRG